MRRFLLPILLVLAVSCSEPLSTEKFIRGEGPYEFTVEMADSLARYDFDLFTRIDAKSCPGEAALIVRWVSPSDSTFRETVYLPLKCGDVYEPYRKGCVPVEYGTWKCIVAVPEAVSIDGFRGLGLVIRRDYGAR